MDLLKIEDISSGPQSRLRVHHAAVPQPGVPALGRGRRVGGTGVAVDPLPVEVRREVDEPDRGVETVEGLRCPVVRRGPRAPSLGR